jgi:hypothetical protein
VQNHSVWPSFPPLLPDAPSNNPHVFLFVINCSLKSKFIRISRISQLRGLPDPTLGKLKNNIIKLETQSILGQLRFYSFNLTFILYNYIV